MGGPKGPEQLVTNTGFVENDQKSFFFLRNTVKSQFPGNMKEFFHFSDKSEGNPSTTTPLFHYKISNFAIKRLKYGNNTIVKTKISLLFFCINWMFLFANWMFLFA